MNMQPLRFITNLNVKLPCVDRSDDNIIYFDNYVLYRPNYRRPKSNDGFDYQNAVLVDLANSHIDINKFYDLLKSNDIDIKKQSHIMFKGSTVWTELLEQSCVTKYLEIPGTNLYHLHRIQYCKDSDKLLITHFNYDYSDDELCTLIDTKNMVILRSNFGPNFVNFYEPNLYVYKILSKMNIVYDCKFSYLDMDEESYLSNNTITKYNYREDTINLKNILAKKKELINTLPETEYTFYGTGIVKHNGLLFINKNAWDTKWYYEQFSLNRLPEVIISEMPPELQDIIRKYHMHDVYTYIKKINALMQVIGIIRLIRLLDKERVFRELNIPNTFAGFCAVCAGF